MKNSKEQNENEINRNKGRDMNPKKSPFSEHENASANRGGTSDMGEDALTTGRPNRTERGSGISTKKNVTGSDYDGQVSGA